MIVAAHQPTSLPAYYPTSLPAYQLKCRLCKLKELLTYAFTLEMNSSPLCLFGRTIYLLTYSFAAIITTIVVRDGCLSNQYNLSDEERLVSYVRYYHYYINTMTTNTILIQIRNHHYLGHKQ